MNYFRSFLESCPKRVRPADTDSPDSVSSVSNMVPRSGSGLTPLIPTKSESEGRREPTDKTDTTSPLNSGSGHDPTDKTDETPFVSSVSYIPTPLQLTSPPSAEDEVVSTPPSVVEATFRSAAEWIEPPHVVMGAKVAPLDPAFPPCPKCGTRRYWILRGKVLCGSRRCYSAVRFILTRIEYQSVH
jgi:hypothetical protein